MEPCNRDEGLSDSRPRLREDALWLPLRGGLVLKTHALSFRLVGRSLYRMMETLAPLADGSRRPEEILDHYPSSLRASAMSLIRVLLQRGVLIDDSSDDIADVRVRAIFQEPIAFVRHFANGAAGFQRFRDARMLLVGDGVPFESCATALLRTGLRQLTLQPLDTTAESLAPIFRTVRRLRDIGLDAAVEVLDGTATDTPPVDDYTIVAYTGAAAHPRAIVRLNRECSRARRSLLVGLVLGPHTIIGPLIDGIASGCWMCGFVRLGPDLVDEGSLPASLRAGSDAAMDAKPATTATRELQLLLGREMAFELFKYLAGNLRPQTREHVIVSTAESADSFAVRCVPHPLCGCMRFCIDACERDLPPLKTNEISEPTPS